MRLKDKIRQECEWMTLFYHKATYHNKKCRKRITVILPISNSLNYNFKYNYKIYNPPREIIDIVQTQGRRISNKQWKYNGMKEDTPTLLDWWKKVRPSFNIKIKE